MVSNGTTKAWIFRKGNGQLRVHPSPVFLKPDGALRLYNVTEAEAEVSVPPRILDAPSGASVSIAPGAFHDFVVVARGAAYFEYDVVVRGQYAEGGSKPGGFVDP